LGREIFPPKSIWVTNSVGAVSKLNSWAAVVAMATPFKVPGSNRHSFIAFLAMALRRISVVLMTIGLVTRPSSLIT
jgi:hypothetical protein